MINLYSEYLESQDADRIKAIEVIEDMRYGRAFTHYETAKVYASKVTTLTLEERLKLFVPKGYMERLISEQVNFSPILNKLEWKTKSKVNPQRVNRMYKSLKVNNWKEILLWETYDNQISKGDQFFEIFFVKSDSAPRLKSLNPKYMTQIHLDDYGRVLAYVYQQNVVKSKLDILSNTALVKGETQRTVTWVFEKGKTTILDPINVLKRDGEIIYDDDNEPVINPVIRFNPPELKDYFLLLHIPSIKRQDEEFSEIIATRAIDDCIKADQISSDINYANRMNGSPVTHAINLKLKLAESSRSPGGFINWEIRDSDSNFQLQKQEIDNDLKSLEMEQVTTEDDLYRKMYLVRPSQELKLASSDSSRVSQQARRSLEKLLKRLTYNINNAMNTFFHIAQISYGYTNTYDFFFEIPDPIISNGAQEELLTKVQRLSAGLDTLKDIWRSEGLAEKEIELKEKEHLEQYYAANEDVSISKNLEQTVQNGQGVDKQFMKT